MGSSPHHFCQEFSGALCAVAALMALVIRRRRPNAPTGGPSVAVAGA
ncbi:hypothetical protein [Streptomyces heilongjiangensis]|uniref:Uncharacterized protein n=1 Tax=Streptomyces heilongjiangensis TaxID=945052 RepID=A0ABW1B360_9ACTN|nr:hypothetical protein [Streptomyces heilongjiangensis]MDC2946880.1 hypothetical protein [Streptomyces heilongjiangensis]